MVCISGCKVALVAFVWPFSTVRFQMSLQMACLRRCKVTLVAFVWLFSTVLFQMCPQMACMGRCIVTLVAFIWFNHTVSLCHQAFPILQTKVIIFKIFLHCHCVLCFAQNVASNWVKFIVDFCSTLIRIVHFSIAYFHFFTIEKQMPYRKNAIDFLAIAIFLYGNFPGDPQADVMHKPWNWRISGECKFFFFFAPPT